MYVINIISLLLELTLFLLGCIDICYPSTKKDVIGIISE